MRFIGLLLKESLQDERVLTMVRIVKIESWPIQEPADFQPPVWTAVFFEGDTSQVDAFAQALSSALKPRWYADFSTETDRYIVFPGRIFTYPKGDAARRAEAQQYGLSLGIPERQLDWGE